MSKKLFFILFFSVFCITLISLIGVYFWSNNNPITVEEFLSTHSVRIGTQSDESYDPFIHLLNRDVKIAHDSVEVTLQFSKIRFLLTEEEQPILTLLSTFGEQGNMISSNFRVNGDTLDVLIYISPDTLRNVESRRVSLMIGWYLEALAQLVEANEAKGYSINLELKGAGDEIDFLKAQEDFSIRYEKHGESALPFILREGQ